MSFSLANFYSTTRGARKVIVVDLGFLGDTVHLLPALWELKAAYTPAQLHVLTTPVGAEVLNMTPCVERAWAVEMYREKRRLGQQWQVVRGLRRETFDVAYNFSGADRTLFMTALSGARRRVAYPGGRRHFWNRWLVPHWAPRQDPDRTVCERHLQMLRDCGVPAGAARFDLRIAEEARQWAASIVPEFAMHVSVNSAKATREWPLEHHAALFRELWAKFPALKVLASGSDRSRERERLRALETVVKDGRLRVLPPELRIAQLAAALQRCRLHLGPDSGVLHLAAALGVPTVSFFREQGSYKSFMPAGPKHHVFTEPCACVDGRDAPCELLGRAECFARIEPAKVAARVVEALADR